MGSPRNCSAANAAAFDPLRAYSRKLITAEELGRLTVEAAETRPRRDRNTGPQSVMEIVTARRQPDEDDDEDESVSLDEARDTGAGPSSTAFASSARMGAEPAMVVARSPAGARRRRNSKQAEQEEEANDNGVPYNSLRGGIRADRVGGGAEGGNVGAGVRMKNSQVKQAVLGSSFGSTPLDTHRGAQGDAGKESIENVGVAGGGGIATTMEEQRIEHGRDGNESNEASSDSSNERSCSGSSQHRINGCSTGPRSNEGSTGHDTFTTFTQSNGGSGSGSGSEGSGGDGESNDWTSSEGGDGGEVDGGGSRGPKHRGCSSQMDEEECATSISEDSGSGSGSDQNGNSASDFDCLGKQKKSREDVDATGVDESQRDNKGLSSKGGHSSLSGYCRREFAKTSPMAWSECMALEQVISDNQNLMFYGEWVTGEFNNIENVYIV